MKNPCQLWDHNVVANVRMACVILHNMVIEGEENLVLELVIELPDKIQLRKD